MAFGIGDAISAAVGYSLAARENLQERIPPYMLPLKEMAGFP